MRTIGKNLCDSEFGHGFLYLTPKVQAIKEKKDKLNFLKIKNFCSLKDFINNVKIRFTEWENIFKSYIH